MKNIDLICMSFSNLYRRKLRTILTILGVIVGTASIVVMLSLGLGLKKSSIEQIEKQGGLTTITVYLNEFADNSVDSESEKKVQRLDDSVVNEIKKISNIKLVSPVLQLTALAKYGAYEAYLTITGMTEEALNNMGLNIGRGKLPSSKSALELFWGNMVQNNFYSTKGNDTTVSIDPMKDTIFYILDTEAYYQWKNPDTTSGTVPAVPPKKYLIPVSGVLAGGADEYTNQSYEVYAEIDTFKDFVKKAFKNKAIPGQPTRKNGKPYKELVYNQIYVQVDGIDHVESVQKTIRELGLEANSNMEWLKQVQEQMKSIQLGLGAIGAVSLFVAAIGIANTMMMSIYERTKEIGILKVLGCDLSDIYHMFLLEAGGIGIIGGALGIVLSFGISFVVNIVTKNISEQLVSYIPPWLCFSALIGATIVGIIAGLFPALRAMRLSPLAALRNE